MNNQDAIRAVLKDAPQPAHPASFDRDKLVEELAEPDTQRRLWEVWDHLKKNQPLDYEDFRMTEPVWVLVLNHEQTVALTDMLSSGGGAVLDAAGVASSAILAALAASVLYIGAVDLLGGNNGVEITGVIGCQGVVVTPRLKGGPYNDFAQSTRTALAAVTVLDWVVSAVAASPVLATALQFAPLAAVASALAAGTPLRLALAAAALGRAVEELLGLGGTPDPNEHGQVLADRGAVGPWESFLMGDNGDGSVSLLSHMGLFSADGGGGGGVYANRPKTGDWERWYVIRHGDHTVSLRTINGHFSTAERQGGAECNANRTEIGPWDKCWLEPLDGGRVALKSFRDPQYVSVQL